jgi:GntR family transcriptional repressor for pyruvate dehydrogenase complex
MIREIHDVVPPIAAGVALEQPQLPALAEVSMSLEALAAKLAAQRRTPQDLGVLSATITNMEDEIAAGGTGTGADRAFHLAVQNAARNAVLTTLSASLATGAAEIAKESLARPGQPERSLATHRHIFEAIATRDGDEASRLMLDHLAITGEIDNTGNVESPD